MSDQQDGWSREREVIHSVKNRGPLARAMAYTRLSGPGWLQAAITLGGGSLASSLYLGILAGFGMLWLQPFAMILGVAMLSCIAYVTLSTGERPFRAINRHINPVLGWAWLLASLLANMVWSLPQFSLATGVLEQNLGMFSSDAGRWICSLAILLVTVGITWSYGTGNRGVRIYEGILKLMVAMIVLCFIGVVLDMFASGSGVSFGEIMGGFIPDLSRLSTPAEGFAPFLQAIEETSGKGAHDFWHDYIVGEQQDVMLSAAATAVGINMTFLMGYALLARGWNREFRGLAVFDLSIGMLIPFVLATSCVVISAASQFHLKPAFEFDRAGAPTEASPRQLKSYGDLVKARFGEVPSGGAEGEVALPEVERNLAAFLARRDVQDLALSLEPLTGTAVAHWIFGLGVLGMALSTITILMLISGFAVCEMFHLPHRGWPFRIGCLAAAAGVLGPFFWDGAQAWLAVPTSVFAFTLLPIAYISFFLLFNKGSLMKGHMPAGKTRILWNALLFFAAALATLSSLYAINQKVGWPGLAGVLALLALALFVQFFRKAGRKGS